MLNWIEQKFNEFYKKRKIFCESHGNMVEKIDFEYWQKNELFQYYRKGVTEATKELEKENAELEEVRSKQAELINRDTIRMENLKYRIKKLEKENAELEAQIEQLQKINSEQKETLKKVRVALIQERTANIMNYGKGGVEMFDSMLEILKGVSN